MKPPRFLLINHKGCRYCQDAEMVMDPNGPLIGYAWYEKIEAENARLEAEVERLREAGDAMAERCLKMQYTEVPWEYGQKWYAWHSKAEASVQAWNAAKEGKQP